MGKFEKLLLKAKNNPKHVRFEELDKILIRAVFRRRQCRYIYSKGTERVTVPFDQPHVKAKYVELVIKALEGEIDNE